MSIGANCSDGHGFHDKDCPACLDVVIAAKQSRIDDLEAAIKSLLDGNESAKEANITHLRDVLDRHAK